MRLRAVRVYRLARPLVFACPVCGHAGGRCPRVRSALNRLALLERYRGRS